MSVRPEPNHGTGSIASGRRCKVVAFVYGDGSRRAVTDGSWPRGRARDGGVDEVPLPTASGGLWLCGKHLVGPDPEAALTRIGATTVVCLTERHELDDRYPLYVDWLTRETGGRAVWHPIADLHAPGVDTALPLLDGLVHRLRADERLLMHCGAGIGRAGTVAVCMLMVLGAGRDEALETVASSRPSAGPEVGAQRQLVDALALSLTAERDGARPPGR